MLRGGVVSVALTAIMALTAQASASVQLTIRDSRVWLKTERATIAEILAEWSRVGATQMVNTERITSPLLTLDLRGVPEMEALDVIMRSAGGFVAVSRTDGVEASGLSRFSRVVIVPSAANGGTRVAAPPPTPTLAPATPAPPATMPAPVTTESGAQRLIGPDGQLVPDDQEDAPPSSPSPSPPVMRPGGSIPPGFSEPPDAPTPPKAPRPGSITPPVPPRRPGDATSD
jgi:hypothetical protein